MLPLLPLQCTMSRGRREKNHFPSKFLWFAIVQAAPPKPPLHRTQKTEGQGEPCSTWNTQPLARATERQAQSSGSSTVQSYCGNQSAQKPCGNPFPPHKPQTNKDHSLAWRLIVTFLSFALPVGCICLSATTGKHLLCYRQPLAIGGAGVAASAAVCIWIDQIAYFKNCANGATVLSKW